MGRLVFVLMMFLSHHSYSEVCRVKAYNLVNYSMNDAVLLWGSQNFHNTAFKGDVKNWQSCFLKARELAETYAHYWKEGIDVYWYGVDHVYFKWSFGSAYAGLTSKASGSVNKFSPLEPIEGKQIFDENGNFLNY